MSNITSSSVLIDVLGGNQKVAAITGSKPSAVSGWRNGRLPAATYVVLQKRIRKMGLNAPDKLWSMRPKPKRRVKA